MVSLIVWHNYGVTWVSCHSKFDDGGHRGESIGEFQQVPQVLKTADDAFTVIHIYITPVLNTHDYMRLNTYTCTFSFPECLWLVRVLVHVHQMLCGSTNVSAWS